MALQQVGGSGLQLFLKRLGVKPRSAVLTGPYQPWPCGPSLWCAPRRMALKTTDIPTAVTGRVPFLHLLVLLFEVHDLVSWHLCRMASFLLTFQKFATFLHSRVAWHCQTKLRMWISPEPLSSFSKGHYQWAQAKMDAIGRPSRN